MNHKSCCEMIALSFHRDRIRCVFQNSNPAYTGPRDRTVANKSSRGFDLDLFGALSDRPASVSIVALQDITAGEEVYNNYGRKGNARLLATYG